MIFMAEKKSNALKCTWRRKQCIAISIVSVKQWLSDRSGFPPRPPRAGTVPVDTGITESLLISVAMLRESYIYSYKISIIEIRLIFHILFKIFNSFCFELLIQSRHIAEKSFIMYFLSACLKIPSRLQLAITLHIWLAIMLNTSNNLLFT